MHKNVRISTSVGTVFCGLQSNAGAYSGYWSN